MTPLSASLESAPAVRSILAWIVALLVPVALVLTAVRALLTPVYVPIIYSLPGFPPDSFGFSREDRLHWSGFAVGYLLNDAGIEYLGDLRFADGQPVFNQRELDHMLDVKIVVQAALKVWVASLGLLTVLGVVAGFTHLGETYRQGLARGGLLTVLLLGAVVLFALLAFGVIFVAFHEVFFAPGTWTFLYSDTLIRMYPEFFWRMAFFAVGLLAGLPGLALWYFFRK